LDLVITAPASWAVIAPKIAIARLTGFAPKSLVRKEIENKPDSGKSCPCLASLFTALNAATA